MRPSNVRLGPTLLEVVVALGRMTLGSVKFIVPDTNAYWEGGVYAQYPTLLEVMGVQSLVEGWKRAKGCHQSRHCS